MIFYIVGALVGVAFAQLTRTDGLQRQIDRDQRWDEEDRIRRRALESYKNGTFSEDTVPRNLLAQVKQDIQFSESSKSIKRTLAQQESITNARAFIRHGANCDIFTCVGDQCPPIEPDQIVRGPW